MPACKQAAGALKRKIFLYSLTFHNSQDSCPVFIECSSPKVNQQFSLLYDEFIYGLEPGG